MCVCVRVCVCACVRVCVRLCLGVWGGGGGGLIKTQCPGLGDSPRNKDTNWTPCTNKGGSFSVCLSACLPACLPACLSLYMSVCLITTLYTDYAYIAVYILLYKFVNRLPYLFCAIFSCLSLRQVIVGR